MTEARRGWGPMAVLSAGAVIGGVLSAVGYWTWWSTHCAQAIIVGVDTGYWICRP